MKKEDLKWAFYLIALGASLVAYAHATFATKSTVERMDERIYEIWQKVVTNK
jgi:bacteriorhodopsin